MPRLPIVDFHSHFVGSSLPLSPIPEGQRALWEPIHRLLADADAPMASVEASGIAARVISAPLEFVQGAAASAPELMTRLNDAVAATVRRHPGRLYGLATVDAYGGDASARELRRAVNELGLRGVFVESAKGALLPDAPEARPTFAVAAELGIPVFLHPVADPQLHARFKAYGRSGARLTRGTINAAALVALLESGMFEELPGLRVVVTALALGGIFLAGNVRERNVFIDTTGLDPVAVRSAVELLGAGRVLMGTDWPVIRESAERVETVLGASGLAGIEREMVAGRNTLELLGAA